MHLTIMTQCSFVVCALHTMLLVPDGRVQQYAINCHRFAKGHLTGILVSDRRPKLQDSDCSDDEPIDEPELAAPGATFVPASLIGRLYTCPGCGEQYISPNSMAAHYQQDCQE